MAGEEVLLVAVAAMILTMGISFVVYARRYVKAGPDQALVVFGKRGSDGETLRVVPPGGGMFVVPIVMQKAFLDVSTHQVAFKVSRAQTKQGIPLTINFAVIFRPSRDPAALRRCAQALLSKTPEEVDILVEALVASSARSTAAGMTVEGINDDRLDFGAKVVALLQPAFYDLGLELQNLVVKDLSDEVGYLEALGKAHAAGMIRDAVIKEVNARRNAATHAAGGKSPGG
jgi:flotillin